MSKVGHRFCCARSLSSSWWRAAGYNKDSPNSVAILKSATTPLARPDADSEPAKHRRRLTTAARFSGSPLHPYHNDNEVDDKCACSGSAKVRQLLVLIEHHGTYRENSTPLSRHTSGDPSKDHHHDSSPSCSERLPRRQLRGLRPLTPRKDGVICRRRRGYNRWR